MKIALAVINTISSQILLMAFTFSILAVICFGEMLPQYGKEFIYSISLSIKWLINLVVPFIILTFMASSLSSFKNGALMLLTTLFICIFASNFIAVLYSYAFTNLTIHFVSIKPVIESNAGKLETLWQMPKINLVSNDVALFLGMLSGILSSFWQNQVLLKSLATLQRIVTRLIKYAILPLLPIFVAGSLLKMEHDQILDNAFSTYTTVFILFCLAQLLYTVWCYLIAANFKFKYFLTYLKNISPAVLTGFTTMSSAATLPLTMIATEKNIKNRKFTSIIVPATCNVHLAGTAIGMNVLILCIFKLYSYSIPEFLPYMWYALCFALAQFAVAGVPGGSVFTLIPLVESHFGVVPEMSALIITLVILFDPVDTSMNIGCNGAFAIMFKKIYRWFSNTSYKT